MIYKLVLTSITPFFQNEAQLPFALVVVIVFTFLVLYMQPYIEASNDRLQLTVQVEIYLLLLIAYVLRSNYIMEGSVEDVLLSILLIAVTLWVVLYLFYAIIIYVRGRIRKKQGERMDKLMKRMDPGSSSSEEIEMQTITTSGSKPQSENNTTSNSEQM